MTRKKEAEEDRMEWLNGGKGKKRAVCCILVTHQGLETKAAPSASSSAPPHPPKLSLLTGREGETVQLPDRWRPLPNAAHALICFSAFFPARQQLLWWRPRGNNAAADADY